MNLVEAIYSFWKSSGNHNLHATSVKMDNIGTRLISTCVVVEGIGTREVAGYHLLEHLVHDAVLFIFHTARV